MRCRTVFGSVVVAASSECIVAYFNAYTSRQVSAQFFLAEGFWKHVTIREWDTGSYIRELKQSEVISLMQCSRETEYIFLYLVRSLRFKSVLDIIMETREDA